SSAGACWSVLFPSYQPEFNDRDHLPAATPVDESYEAAARHFSPNRLNPDILTAATIRTNTRSRNMLSPLATDSNSRGRSPSPTMRSSATTGSATRLPPE
ncbi:hypothetical protein, partial [Mycolicibacterium setense]|uniref:hypothetical protein n=1 Tax=Mycolicibacterium setense TaxID=431269 RepID=UPI0021F30624